MRSRSLLSVSALVVAGAVAGVDSLHAQAAAPMKIDPVAAQWGQYIWKNRQCQGCHELGRDQSTGPDLVGVTNRRSADWLRSWFKDPSAMTSSDSIAMALKKKYGSQMPNLDLKPRDIEGLINYLAQETQSRTGK